MEASSNEAGREFNSWFIFPFLSQRTSMEKLPILATILYWRSIFWPNTLFPRKSKVFGQWPNTLASFVNFLRTVEFMRLKGSVSMIYLHNTRLVTSLLPRSLVRDSRQLQARVLLTPPSGGCTLEMKCQRIFYTEYYDYGKASIADRLLILERLPTYLVILVRQSCPRTVV